MSAIEEALPGAAPRPEPRSLTTIDLMAIVAGMAIGLVSGPVGRRPDHFYVIANRVGVVSHTIDSWWAQAVALLAPGAALAVVGRCWRYGRMPRPGEWLIVLVTAAILGAGWLGGPETGGPSEIRGARLDWAGDGMTTLVLAWANRPPRVPSDWLALISGLGASLFAAGVVVIAWRRLSPWLKVCLLAIAAFVLLGGPLGQVESWTSPPSHIDFDPSWIDHQDWPSESRFGFEVAFMAPTWLARWPRGLLFAIPAVAVVAGLRRRGPRRWAWTEWLGVAVGTILGGSWFYDELVLRAIPPDWGARALDLATWLAAVVAPAVVIVAGVAAARGASAS